MENIHPDDAAEVAEGALRLAQLISLDAPNHIIQGECGLLLVRLGTLLRQIACPELRKHKDEHLNN